MAFTIAEVKETAEDTWLSNVTIDGGKAIKWINQLLRDPKMHKLWGEDTQEYEADEDTWYDLPTDCANIIEVIDTDDYEYDRYLVRNFQVSFPDANTYTLYHTVFPAKLTGINDAIPLLDVCEDLCAKYLAGRYLFSAKDPDTKQGGYQMFNEALDETNKVLGTFSVDASGFEVDIKW